MVADGRSIPLRFGTDNHVPFATLTCDPAPSPKTPIERLKNALPQRLVIWESLTRDLVIEGRHDEARLTDFIALPGSSLTGLDEVRLDLFADAALEELVYTSDFQPLAEAPEIGVWPAGRQAFGVPVGEDRPDVFTLWLDESVLHRGFRLVIRRSSDGEASDDLALRMLVLGERLQVERNFEYGGSIRFQTSPELERTSSGLLQPVRPPVSARALSLSLPMASDADRKRVRRMEKRLAGGTVIVDAHPGREGWQHDEYAFLARFAGAIEYGHRFEDVHTMNFELVEA